MSKETKYAFSERFRLNNKTIVTLDYGNVGVNISVDSKPRSLEDAVADYTVGVLKKLGIKAENLTFADYEAIDYFISQQDLLSKTGYGSVKELLSRCH